MDVRDLYRERRKLIGAIDELDKARREGDRKDNALIQKTRCLAVIFVVVGVLVNSAVLTIIW